MTSSTVEELESLIANEGNEKELKILYSNTSVLTDNKEKYSGDVIAMSPCTTLQDYFNNARNLKRNCNTEDLSANSVKIIDLNHVSEDSDFSNTNNDYNNKETQVPKIINLQSTIKSSQSDLTSPLEPKINRYEKDFKKDLEDLTGIK